jgi:hypothetical protein
MDWFEAGCHFPDSEINSNIPEIKRLVKYAGLNVNCPYAADLGYGQRAMYTINVFDKYPTNEADYVPLIIKSFDSCEGIFRTRAIDAINPLSWINAIVFLPRVIFEYLGSDPNKAPVKIIQLFWWIVAPLGIIFRERLYEYISAVLSSF